MALGHNCAVYGLNNQRHLISLPSSHILVNAKHSPSSVLLVQLPRREALSRGCSIRRS